MYQEFAAIAQVISAPARITTKIPENAKGSGRRYQPLRAGSARRWRRGSGRGAGEDQEEVPGDGKGWGRAAPPRGGGPAPPMAARERLVDDRRHSRRRSGRHLLGGMRRRRGQVLQPEDAGVDGALGIE